MYRRRNWMLVILGIILTAIGGAGLFISIFMAQHSVGMLLTSPNINMGLFFAITLIGVGLFVFGIEKDPCEIDNARLDVSQSIRRWNRLYKKENGVNLTEFAIQKHIDDALACDYHTLPKVSDDTKKKTEEYKQNAIAQGKPTDKKL